MSNKKYKKKNPLGCHTNIDDIIESNPSAIKEFLETCSSENTINSDINLNDLNNNFKTLNKKVSSKDSLSYINIARECIVFNNLIINVENDLTEFLKYYTKKYNNYYSNSFKKNIKNLSFGRVTSLEDYEFQRDLIVERNRIPYIIYLLKNRVNKYIRVGYSGDSPAGRLYKYLVRSFGNSNKKLTNLHFDIRELKKNRENICKIFEFQPIFVLDNLPYVKIIESFLTIFYNRAENDVGYDLSINNYYNPIIGDAIELAKDRMLKGKLNPMWKNIKPIDFSNAIKEEPTIETIEKRLSINHTTILRKIEKFGFVIYNKNVGLKDARAYFIKPIIEEAVKRDLTIQQCIKLCFDNGITFFRNYALKEEQINIFCEYIWHDKFQAYNIYSRHRFVNVTYTRVRKIIITEEALEMMKNPLINTLKKAKSELNNRGVVIRNEKELSDILTWSLKLGYTQCQDKLLKSQFKTFLTQISPVLSLGDIAKKLKIKPTPQNLSILRHKIYYLFKCSSINQLRKELWKNNSIFDIFNNKNNNRDKVITYVCSFTSILSNLYKYTRDNFTFMGSNLARYMRMPRRTINTHISVYLMPLGILKLIEQRGNYKQFSLTQKGEIFLKYVFGKLCYKI